MMGSRRLFFALWPTADMQSELAAAVRAPMESMRAGRSVPRENLHVTLAFLGSVPGSSMPVLRELAGSAPWTPADEPQPVGSPRSFEVMLDTIEHWPRAQILCTAASGEPAEVARFAESLKQSLSGAGFAPDLKPFRAHVTLARKVKRRPPDRQMTPVRWTFNHFALVASQTLPSGSLYSVLESWPLFRA